MRAAPKGTLFSETAPERHVEVEDYSKVRAERKAAEDRELDDDDLAALIGSDSDDDDVFGVGDMSGVVIESDEEDEEEEAAKAEAKRMQNAIQAAKHVKEGRELQEKGDYGAAIDCFSEAVLLTPKSHEPYIGRSACYAKLENMEATAAEAQRCIDLNPTCIAAYCYLAQCIMNGILLPRIMTLIRPA